jgi:hypothetical protein
MIDWLINNPDVAAAIATVLLTVFGAIQITLEVARRADRRASVQIEAEGPAWLARRSFQSAMVRAATATSPLNWASDLTSGALDRLEHQMLELLRLASLAGGGPSKSARGAFEGFIAFADRVNTLAAFRPAAIDAQGAPQYSADDKQLMTELFSGAFDAAAESWTALTRLAPYRLHEPRPPQRSDVRLIAGSASSRP